MMLRPQLLHCWKAWRTIPVVRLCSQSTTNLDKDGKFNTRILEYLVCPLTKRTLEYDAERQLLISRDIEVAYAILNGIPNMNPKDAKKLKELDGPATAKK